MSTKNSSITIIALLCALVLFLAAPGCKKESETEEQPVEETPAVYDENTIPDEVIEEPDEGSMEEEFPEEMDTPPVVEEIPMPIVPLTGVGPVTFGMSQEQVIEALGEPDESEFIMMLYLKSYGISITFQNGLVHQINCYSKQYPNVPQGTTTFQGQTEQGIGMGASGEDIISAYGQPNSIEDKRGMEILNYISKNAEFLLLNDKLVSVKLKAP